MRETWLRDLKGAEYRFFLGGPPSAMPDAEDDCVYLFCSDAYDKLPTKTRAAMQWAVAKDYDHVFKCDDDTYVRPDRLLASGFEEFGYTGFTEGRFHSSGSAMQVYAYAQGGAGYWLGRKAMQLVADNEGTHYCEDCGVGITLGVNGISPIHDTRYAPQVGPLELEYPDSRRNLITLHKVSPDQMRRLYAADQKEKANAYSHQVDGSSAGFTLRPCPQHD